MTSPHALDAAVAQRVRPLWKYLALAARPVRADAIFVFGSKDFAVPDRAAELYRSGYASRVVVTGSFGRLTRNVFPKSEALMFKDRLVQAGVPETAVLTEEKSANTLENVRFGMDTLRSHGVQPQTLLLVAKGFVMRRCVATFAHQYGSVTVVPCPPRGDVGAAVDRSGPEFVARLVAEVDRLERYAAQGDVRRQDLPEALRPLLDELRAEL